MGFLGSLLGATLKVAVTPLAIVKDVVDVTQGDAPVNTVGLLGSATADVVKGVGDLTDGKVL